MLVKVGVESKLPPRTSDVKSATPQERIWYEPGYASNLFQRLQEQGLAETSQEKLGASTQFRPVIRRVLELGVNSVVVIVKIGNFQRRPLAQDKIKRSRVEKIIDNKVGEGLGPSI